MEYPSIHWLLFVFIAFSLTIQNITLLPSIQDKLFQLALVIATISMNMIIFLYYPFKALIYDNSKSKLKEAIKQKVAQDRN